MTEQHKYFVETVHTRLAEAAIRSKAMDAVRQQFFRIAATLRMGMFPDPYGSEFAGFDVSSFLLDNDEKDTDVGGTARGFKIIVTHPTYPLEKIFDNQDAATLAEFEKSICLADFADLIPRLVVTDMHEVKPDEERKNELVFAFKFNGDVIMPDVRPEMCYGFV